MVNEQETLMALAREWYHRRGWQPFPFQTEMMEQYLDGKSGLLNAPTGSGKTYAVWIPILLGEIRQASHTPNQKTKGLKALWITPLRALSKDIARACQSACTELGLPWRVELRSGDVSSSVKEKQKRNMPEALITTPESMHVLFSGKGHAELFRNLEVVVVDEWHELLGSKRGVQTELVIAHLRQINPKIKIWGISATIGNLEQALEVLLGDTRQPENAVVVRSGIRKKIVVESVLPDTIERFPWSGHLGIHLIDKVLPIIHQSKSCLIFTNTRAQAEIWYQHLLETDPDLAGILAMHHGSIAAETRAWVEEALHLGQLKAVVCTSSLDLGVDFRPVDTIIQIGGPKGVARFLQRAGRSGHRPGETSKIYFVPTHSLELIEAAALKEAVETGIMEDRLPVLQPADVLIQYMMTLAVADGFEPEPLWQEITQTYAYRDLDKDDFRWMLQFITTGGHSLSAYEAYRKAEISESGKYQVTDKKIALQHRLSIGSIVSDTGITVKFISGGRLGTVEESFISQLKEGDTFWFSGRLLELIRIRNLEALVRKASGNKGIVPRWMGSRMPLSSQMSAALRRRLDEYLSGELPTPEMQCLRPLLDLQHTCSAVPAAHECLIESIQSREGYHLYIYPFEGRVVHEIMATLTAWRISRLEPITFSLAMNDYGFELLSDKPIPIEKALQKGLFSSSELDADLHHSINETEMALRRFREIATIAGLLFKGYPGRSVQARHLQASSSLLFRVFQDYDPGNLLLRQAFNEVIDYQIDGRRLRAALDRLDDKNILLKYPQRFTPFSFPIMTDRLRERLSSEKLADRIARMQVILEKAVS